MTGQHGDVRRATFEPKLVRDAATFVVRTGVTSGVALSRRFHIGHRRAEELLQVLENHGVLGHRRGDQPREVLVERSHLTEVLESLPSDPEGTP